MRFFILKSQEDTGDDLGFKDVLVYCYLLEKQRPRLSDLTTDLHMKKATVKRCLAKLYGGRTLDGKSYRMVKWVGDELQAVEPAKVEAASLLFYWCESRNYTGPQYVP